MAPAEPAVEVRSLHAKIGEMTLENDLSESALTKAGIAERKTMIDREHDLSITRQAQVLKISRGSVYYLPRTVPDTDVVTMRRLDRLHLEFPFAGARSLRGLLAAEGCKIGRRHVKMLMQRMEIEALYRRPRTTRRGPAKRSIRICCAASRSRNRTMSGRWTSPIFRWRVASSISQRCSTRLSSENCLSSNITPLTMLHRSSVAFRSSVTPFLAFSGIFTQDDHILRKVWG